jgi:acetyltransferase EpsM
MTSDKLMILGAGRQATETFCLLEDIGMANGVVGFVQDELPEKETIMNVPVITREVVLRDFNSSTRPMVIGAIGTIKDNKRMVEIFLRAGFEFFSAIPGSINLSRQKFIGVGVTVGQGTILTVNVTIDDHTLINIGCTLSHDVKIGKYVNISPGVHLAGYVTVEDEVFIGTAATMIPRVTIGKGSYVAAGACVTQDVPPYSMVAGVPAKVKKGIHESSK